MSTVNKYGLFFDLDGTLTDNIQFMFEIYEHFMGSISVPYSREEFDYNNGIPLKIFFSETKKKYKLTETVDELNQCYEKFIEKGHDKMKPREGVIKLFSYLTEENIPFAIVTSSNRKIATKWVSSNIPKDLEPILITSNDIKNGKPSPEPYLEAMKRLNCTEGFAVEDSQNGILSAASAGLKVFQIGPKNSSKFDKAWRLITDFDEIAGALHEL